MAALEQITQDIRYASRMLRRSPGFAVITILTLALGIGVNTAIFSVISTVLLRPLPYPNAERIVALATRVAPGEHFKSGLAGADFVEWRAHAKEFEKIAAYSYADQTVAGNGTASQIRVVSLTGDLWAIAGAHAALGRLIEPRESPDWIVLSYTLFKRQFGGDPRIVGKVITLGGKPRTVAAILPSDFRFLFPQDWHAGLANAAVEAFVSESPLSRSKALSVVARLKPKASVQSGLTEIQTIQAAILKQSPDRWFPGVSRMSLVPLQAQLSGESRRALLILQVAELFVLLIACANIANLLMARSAARGREIAIRAAMGAGRMRVLRQFLTEGTVLALLAAILGLLVAQWSTVLIVRFGPKAVPRLSDTTLDWHVLAFALTLSLASAVLFSFGPAASLWKTSRQNLIKDEAKTFSAGLGGLRTRRFLVAAELALSIILLTGAGLMLKSFWRMYTSPPGFSPENTLTIKVSLSGPLYADKARQVTYFRELLHRIGALPGVQSFGLANVEDYLLQSAKSGVPNVVGRFRESLVSQGYFRAMGMRLQKGSWFADSDPPDAAVINQTMARSVFGDKNPIGKSIDHLGRSVRVVGVAANLKYAKRDAEPGPEIFRPFAQNLEGGNVTATVVLRMPNDPLGIAAAAHKTISGIDTAQPVYDIGTLEQALEDSVASRRFSLFILATFAIAASLMAFVGVYGVVAYSVTQRTREIGIRMALGAQRSEVVQMLIVQGMAAALLGIAAGLSAALALTRWMASLLYDVMPNDPSTFAVIAVAFAVVVLLASGIPASRAARVDPLVALRHE